MINWSMKPDRWTKWHYTGSLLLTIGIYLISPRPTSIIHAATIAFALGLLWEITDYFKPSWQDWPSLRPPYIPIKIWEYIGWIAAADGFSIYDLIVDFAGVATASILIAIWNQLL